MSHNFEMSHFCPAKTPALARLADLAERKYFLSRAEQRQQ
jgi:hypothetical protein